MTEKVNTKIVITAIIALVVLECMALYRGINGTIYSIVIAAIAGLAGLVIPSPFKTK